ncbi:hypothetical protein TCELL_0472 [Thermogladius calderae 1633]|uniref:Uncharacterized protein n=1 Tax=Thermogladius calderae (strain DSM 22663 / VKM B-2946 / 1633) TaxID=1184251 RepID=I3TDQ9_THEC1|nr:hypothetical protein TCELL_0472 [Thermogladius calderae 1633]
MALLIAVGVLSASIPLGTYLVVEPGVYLEFRFHEPSHDRNIDVTDQLSLSRDVYLCVRAEAVAPVPSDTLLLGFKCYKGIPLLLVPYKSIEPALRAWASVLRSRGVPGDGQANHFFGLIVHAVLLDSSNNSVLYETTYSLPVKLGDLLSPRALKYTVSVSKAGGLYQAVYRVENVLLRPVKNVEVLQVENVEASTTLLTSGSVDLKCAPAYPPFYYCERTYTNKPEYVTAYLPPSYFRAENGILYVKTPVLIANNLFSYSGVVMVSMNIGPRREEAKLTVGTGDILPNITRASLPDISLQLAGRTWGGSTYYYGVGYPVAPNSSAWLYIWARPIQRFVEAYLCSSSECTRLQGRDRVEAFITDVLVNGTTIQGGVEQGLPHPYIMDKFFNATTRTLLVIPDTALSDGALSPGESVSLGNVFQYYDTCGSGSGVGVSGSVIAMGVCAALGLETSGAACAVAATLASAIQISLGTERPGFYVTGGMYNVGSLQGIGYNVDKYVYVAVSKYNYTQPPPWWCPWCGSCVYNVPAGIYFEFA